jgi:hypothetical protein
MKTANYIMNQGNLTKLKLFVSLVLLILSSTGAFAQANTTGLVSTTSTEVSASKDATNVITTDNSVVSTAMDFAIWFMGSKKTTNDSSNETFSKKQLINSGINTNSVLIRSFLKKVSTQEKGIA